MSRKDTVYYHKLWSGKKTEPDRMYMQNRVLNTFKALFSFILSSEFSGKVLDLGCGDGSLVKACIDAGIQAKGIDICDGVDFEADRLPFDDGEFDIAIMYSLLEHLQHPGNLLSETRRVLKPGGKLVVITANFQLNNPLLCEKEFFDDPTHVHPYNRKSIRMLMKMFEYRERFIGLWTACKSPAIWRLPESMQFYYGALLPFKGSVKNAPVFLRGRSRSMLCVFEKSQAKGGA